MSENYIAPKNHLDASGAPSEHLRAIGQIAVNFAILELMIASILIQLLSPDTRVGEIVTAELSFSARVTLLSALSKHLIQDEERKKRLETLLDKALGVQEDRNIIVHSLWTPGDSTDELARMKMTAKKRAGFKTDVQMMTADDLQKIADAIAAVTQELMSFMVDRSI